MSDAVRVLSRRTAVAELTFEEKEQVSGGQADIGGGGGTGFSPDSMTQSRSDSNYRYFVADDCTSDW